MEEKKETFTYTYSAKEQEEIKKIRDKLHRDQAQSALPLTWRQSFLFSKSFPISITNHST